MKPMSILDLQFPERTLSYFRRFNWSLVNNGFGNFSKKKANSLAITKGKGIKIFFLSIENNNFSQSENSS